MRYYYFIIWKWILKNFGFFLKNVLKEIAGIEERLYLLNCYINRVLTEMSFYKWGDGGGALEIGLLSLSEEKKFL